MAKRPLYRDEDEIPQELESYNLVSRLQATGGRAAVINACRTPVDLLMAREDRDELRASDIFLLASQKKWEEVASRFNLSNDQGMSQFKPFTVSRAFLPPSFHREIMKNSASWIDVYQESRSCRQETAGLRLMDAWHVPVCALFEGRVVDCPEHSMPETLGSETSGGWVEHKVYMNEGIILIVVELQHIVSKHLKDYTGQVLLEMASAHKANASKNFKNPPPVYAILTDLHIFDIFCFDGSEFSLYEEEIIVPLFPRSAFLCGMMKVTEVLFSIILQGYIQILGAVSETQAAGGDVSAYDPTSSRTSKYTRILNPRPSLHADKAVWTTALSFAQKAQEILTQVKCTSLEEWESSAASGLVALQSSVKVLPKIGSMAHWSRAELEDEVEKILLGRLKETTTDRRSWCL